MDVESLARGLTKAQREAVLRSEYWPEQSAWWPAGIYLSADKRVRWNLLRLGIIRDYLARLNRLTPLGLAVREYLKGNQNGN